MTAAGVLTQYVARIVATLPPEALEHPGSPECREAIRHAAAKSAVPVYLSRRDIATALGELSASSLRGC